MANIIELRGNQDIFRNKKQMDLNVIIICTMNGMNKKWDEIVDFVFHQLNSWISLSNFCMCMQ